MSSGNSQGSGGQGGSSHRRRNYRHFGPQTGAGSSGSTSSQHGNQQGSGDRPAARPSDQGQHEKREMRDGNVGRDARAQQGNRPDSHNRSNQPPRNQGQPRQGQGNPRNRSGGHKGNRQPGQAGQSSGGQGQPNNRRPADAQPPKANVNQVHVQNIRPVQASNQPAAGNATPAVANPKTSQPVRDQRRTADSREQRNNRGKALAPQSQSQQEKDAQSRQERQNRWERKIKSEETYEDIKRDNERIEKEIWLDIAGIHTIKLDI